MPTLLTDLAGWTTALPDWSAIVFAVSALILVVVAGWILQQAALDRDPLRGSLVVVLAGLALALGYETWALWTGQGPTISRRTAEAFEGHPAVWLSLLVALMLVTGAVVIDFTHRSRLRWLALAAGASASVGGGSLAHVLGWLP
jgi:hypothetical protein